MNATLTDCLLAVGICVFLSCTTPNEPTPPPPDLGKDQDPMVTDEFTEPFDEGSESPTPIDQLTDEDL